jgi:hypothetical protein
MNKEPKPYICNNDECDGAGIEKIPGTVFHSHRKLEDIKAPKEHIETTGYFVEVKHEPKQEPKEKICSYCLNTSCVHFPKQAPKMEMKLMKCLECGQEGPGIDTSSIIHDRNCSSTFSILSSKQAEGWRERLDKVFWEIDSDLQGREYAMLIKFFASELEAKDKERLQKEQK